MAIAGQGLSFFPLYWMFHDQWRYYTYNGWDYTEHRHNGHMHMWMMGFDINSGTGDAFSGRQNYSFELEDVWGPRSADPNQNQVYRVIGSPKWYFRVTELWRRVFIQPWDAKVDTPFLTAKRGIKYDASTPEMTMGPFREGRADHGLKNWSPFWTKNARSLPIDYFTSGDLVQSARDNHVADRARELLGEAYVDEKYNLQHDAWMMAHRQGGPAAGVDTFSDALYIWPVIEYQKVLQMDWESLPGGGTDAATPDEALPTFGDGWAKQLSIPFTDEVTGRYRSPFALQPGIVLPFGQYNEHAFSGGRKLVPLENRLHYATYTQNDTPPLGLPPEKYGQLVQEWHNPWGVDAGGAIVQQCMGGIVEAKAKICIEHKLGGRQFVTTTSTQYIPSTPFEGSDQALPE